MRFGLAAILRAPVCQGSQQPHTLLCQERQNPVIEQVSPHDWRLGGVQLSGSPLGVGIHEGLLVVAPATLDRADVEGVLAAKVTGMSGFYFSAGQMVIPRTPSLREVELCGHGQPLLWGNTAQRHVWAFMVVALHVGVLLGLARLDVFNANALATGPVQQCGADVFQPVVTTYHFRSATPGYDLRQHPDHTMRWQREVHLDA